MVPGHREPHQSASGLQAAPHAHSGLHRAELQRCLHHPVLRRALLPGGQPYAGVFTLTYFKQDFKECLRIVQKKTLPISANEGNSNDLNHI